MKKWIAFLLTLACLMTTSVPAFAASEVDVFFDGNGGTFNYYMDQVRNEDYFGDFAEPGTKISDRPNAVLTDPVFWDSSKSTFATLGEDGGRSFHLLSTKKEGRTFIPPSWKCFILAEITLQQTF